MSWSKRLKVLSFSIIALGGVPLLAACTLTPVYSGRLAEQPSLELAYASPASRLDQVVYQELSLRLGHSDAETAPLAKVVTSVAAARLADTATVNPNKSYEVTVTAKLTITRRDGSAAAPIVLTRMATAGYQVGAQIINDQASFSEASERAARSAAESLRLAVLAALMR